MKKNKQIILAIIVVIALIAIMYTPIGTSVKKLLEGDNHLVGVRDEKLSTEDYNIDLIGYNGAENTNLKNLIGNGEVVFLNFWGTWCPPCVTEMPSIQKLYEAKGDKIKFILIAIQDKPKTITNFLEKNKYTVPAYEASTPINVNLMPHVFPTTYIIDKKGNIILKETSSRDWNDKNINDTLDKLISE